MSWEVVITPQRFHPVRVLFILGKNTLWVPRLT
jgi:hypothetical protein